MARTRHTSSGGVAATDAVALTRTPKPLAARVRPRSFAVPHEPHPRLVAPPLVRDVPARTPITEVRIGGDSMNEDDHLNDDRLNDDIAAQHKRELLWSEEDQRLAEKAMQDEDAA